MSGRDEPCPAKYVTDSAELGYSPLTQVVLNITKGKYIHFTPLII